MTTPPYERNGDWLLQAYPSERGNRVSFWARGVRMTTTGVQATVQIRLSQEDGDRVLASDLMNVDRDDGRGKIARTALRMCQELNGAGWPLNAVKGALDTFCLGLWEQVASETGVELLEPSETLTITKLVGPYVLEGAGTIIFAPPGRGKSFTALTMAVSQDAGCNTIWPVKQRRVLYVNLERSRASMRFRLGCINRALGLEPNRPLPFLNVRGRSLHDVMESVQRGMAQHKCDVLYLDSISRAGMGDLIENLTANRAVDYLNSLAPTWVALGHTPRADDKHLYGSVHFEAGMDIGVQLLAQTRDGTTGIGLQMTKANDIAIPPMEVIALEWDQDGLVGIRPARSHEFPEIEAGKRMSLSDEMAEYLKLVGEVDAGTIADALGKLRQKVSSTLSNDKRFVLVRRDGRSMLYGLRAPDGYSPESGRNA